jgi:hypothetical protein
VDDLSPVSKKSEKIWDFSLDKIGSRLYLVNERANSKVIVKV